jgi:hypothetical protein
MAAWTSSPRHPWWWASRRPETCRVRTYTIKIYTWLRLLGTYICDLWVFMISGDRDLRYTRRHWVARDLLSAISHTKNNREPLTGRKCSRVKVKCTLVQALRLCTGRTAHSGSRAIALLFHDHGTRRGWGVSVTPRPLFTPGKDSVSIAQEAGWASGPVWTGAENHASTGIRSPDRLVHSQ